MLKQFVREVYQIWISERPTQPAAALAFSSMFSFAPVIFIAYSVVGMFADRLDITTQFYERVQSTLGEEMALLIQNSITALAATSSEESILISIISFLALLYAASGVFFQLQYSLNLIWRVPTAQNNQTLNYARQRLVSFVIVIGIGLLGILAVLANLILSWFGSIVERLIRIDANQSFLASLSTLVLVVIVCALFYKILPETKIAWGDVWLGAGVAALLILAAISLAGLFFRYSSANSALQVAGGFSILLLGFYYIAQIFLLGAIVCRVYANLLGSRSSTHS
jgi:membrane protein